MDQPFAEDERTALPQLEQLLLYSMRAWVIGFCRGLPIAERLDEVFAVIGAPGAAAHLCGFMWAIGHGARRLLAVDCVCRAEVSEDERRLLDVLALAQAGRSLEAVLLLRTLITPPAALAAGDSAARLGSALAAAGRKLSPRALATTRYALADEDNVVELRRPLTLH